MLERAEPILRLACILLAGLVVYQLSRVALQKDPLANVTLPVISEKTSAASTNASAALSNTPSTQATNPTAAQSASKTNVASISDSATNSAANARTNAAASTNASALPTNSSTAAVPGPAANPGGSPRSGRPGGPPRNMGGMPPGMGMGFGPGMAAQPPLPPPIQARVDKIIQSEILGPIQRPIPMGLLGIAGRDAFFRAPNGQTGLLREGQELGGVKMLRIGTNRVLIEFEGKQQELMIFSGFGSQTLLSTGKETHP